MIGSQSTDAPKTFVISEVTLDIISEEGSSFLSLLSPISITSAELKRRIAAARERSTDDETYRVYYCGQLLREEDQVPLEIFETADSNPLFKPRCNIPNKPENLKSFYICLVIVFVEKKLSEEDNEGVKFLPNGRYAGSSHQWKSFQSEKRGLSATLSTSKLQANMSTDILKNHFQLEEELIKINCEQYIPALAKAGLLSDEV